MNSPVVTRFAPSPTGLFHIGSARTALFNYLFAKHYGGKMLLRIEDTDTERSQEAYTVDILDGLSWLGILHDGEVEHQSRRTPLYRAHLEKLIASGAAYVSSEVAAEGKRASVIRFKNPNRDVTFHDELRGDITVNTTDLGDFVLAKDLDHPLYHLAVVVDDFTMGVTHVVRGEDGIANTPRQTLIQDALGAPRPVYVHIPLILGPDRTKLSKRHGATPVTEYREQGYLADAVVNFLALLGWSPGDDREFFSLDELIKEFSPERIQTSAAIFNVEKLDWTNREYLKRMDDATFAERVRPYIPKATMEDASWSDERFMKLLPMLRERITKLSDVRTMFVEQEFHYVFSAPSVEKAKLVWKDGTVESARTHLLHTFGVLTAHPEADWNEVALKQALWDYATTVGRGNVLWPMRYALTGREKSPDPFAVATLLGKTETLVRIDRAILLLA